MTSARNPLHEQGEFDAFIVTTRDGRLFRCFIERDSAAEACGHWIFRNDTTEYVGPAYSPLTSLDELASIVSEWWERRQTSASGELPHIVRVSS